MLCCSYIVPKSDQLPPQSVIDALPLSLGIGKYSDYDFKDLEELAVMTYTEIWRLMCEGKSLSQIQKMQRKITYEAHKKWHEEK